MKFQTPTILFVIVVLFLSSCENTRYEQSNIDINNMMIRIAEIEIDSNYVDEYISILKEESENSIRLETGVISIYPMFQKDNPTQIRLLEIYADKEAYESHLKTAHFQKYKTSTFEMVKSLKLIDMEAIDPESMSQIFCKLQK